MNHTHILYEYRVGRITISEAKEIVIVKGTYEFDTRVTYALKACRKFIIFDLVTTITLFWL